jgi:hypothetical protein
MNYLDQLAHFLIGAALVGAAMLVMSWYWGVALSMVVCVGREHWQHPWHCHAGCRLDVGCWLAGSLATPLIYHLLY